MWTKPQQEASKLIVLTRVSFAAFIFHTWLEGALWTEPMDEST